jgi:hypothetical protein
MHHNSLISDAREFEIGWRIWFWILILVNFIAPLFFLGKVEARVMLGAYVVAGVIVAALHRLFGWVRLLGACHFLWIGLLPWLAIRYMTTGPEGAFAYWMLATILVDTTALAIDMVDVARYLRGEQAPIVPRQS